MNILIADTIKVIVLHASFWFVLSIPLKRNDIADIAWGIGFIAIMVMCICRHHTGLYSLFMYAQICCWAVRLSLHIGVRTLAKKEEDFRYRAWRVQWGKSFFWRSYGQVFLLQGIFQCIIALPILVVAHANNYSGILKPFLLNEWLQNLSVLSKVCMAAGFICWVAGFIIQTVADAQLKNFCKTKQPTEIMQSGLWKYSRHPNYLGEILMWWGIWIQICWLPYGLAAIISPITITWLLAFVSGVPMLEKKYAGNPAFEAYKKRTPALFPRFHTKK